MSENGETSAHLRRILQPMVLDRESCDRALEARDPRFDGVFFVGIRTTGIYCRPICPARRTLPENRRFFSNAAAAERAGFRPCLRCRPELAPGRARVDAVPRLADAAARRIAAGALNAHGLDRLAGELGVSARQVRRAMQQELGVSPIELAQTHRLLMAKQLLTETSLRMSEVAYASGFQSLRRFNAAFRERYRLNPEALRRRTTGAASRSGAGRTGEREAADLVRLTLSYRAPMAWDALLAFLGARATPGVERVDGGAYARTVSLDGHTGIIRASMPERVESTLHVDVLHLEVSASLMPVLMPLCARMRHLFDLDAEPAAIEQHLGKAGFARLRRPMRGLRVPGAFDGFELAVRAILGQQVSVKGATTLMARLTRTLGEPIATPDGQLTHLAPDAARVADATVARIRDIGMPVARATTIHLLARQVAAGELRIEPDADVRALGRQLTELPGVGDWTAEYVAMRAVHWPDAFPASDLVLRRAAGDLSPARLSRLAEPWRPWRAYAAMHLWMNDRA
jgi:AraC family transcriptional regulator of adaptative response / DNA-3-methyladenine glycosylase II